ncbi:MAG: hypothetical protein J3R72DRAFT_372754, partial [Linnemannia gamsii]
PAVKTLIQALTECPESEIPKLIEEVPEWNWPRGDIFLWVAVLNRFDDILDTLCKTHDMKKPQPKPFSETDQRLTLAILYFSRLLLENCTNRNLYASYEQLNDLLHSSDLDILESCLRLLLRPAQRHSSQRNTKSIFTVSQDRLLALTHSWGTREHGLEMLQLMDEGAQIPEKLSGLHFQFFRTATYNKPTIATITPAGAAAPASSSSAASGSATTSTQASTTISATPLSSPSKQRRSSQSGSTSTPATTSSIPGSATEGLVVIQAADINNMGASDHEILSHYVKEYSIPEEHQFSLLNRIRVATAMRNPQRRRKLLMIRILGIAVMSHVLPETVVIDKFFAFEPEIIQSLADLIHPDHKVPFDLQTAALFALDGLAHLRNKQADVYTAVNASASHGILLYMLRKTVSGLDSDTVIYPQEFVDAIVAFIGYIISGQTGGNMVIAAGLVPVLLKLLVNKRASQVKNVTKSIHLLDSLIYGYSSAFTSFCTSDGLNILVARIKDETEYALGIVKDFDTSQSPDKSSSASKGTYTRRLLRLFVHHMMQSPGTQEGLRNLIETTLPATLKKIMESPAALGAAIYAHAINTMASFIHNEPTSLAILQEANIPQTLLASLSKEIPISPEVVMSVPGAFGAICLNSAGLTMFKEKFDLKKLFDIFTSIPHVRAFQDNDGASNLGLSVDELVRHQPSLKPTVLSAVITMLDQVFKMCQDITFADDLALSTLQKERSESVSALGEVTEESAAKVPKKDGVVPPLIEAAAKFCESYFQNAAIAKDFLKSGGIDCLMKFYSLHTLPYDLANTSAFFTLSHLIKLLAETTPSTSIIAVVEEVQKQLDVIEPLLESVNPESNLLKFIDISNSTEEDIALGNRYLHALVSLNALSGLLSDMYLTPAFSHGRNQASVLAAFVAAKGDKALNGLGKLHRMCIWETIALKRSLQQDWNDPNPKAKRPSNVALIPGTVEEHFEEPAVEAKELTEKAAPKMDMFSPTAINTKYFKFVLTQTPHYITPLYQGITKMLFHRRDVDSAQRAGAFKIADSLSRVLQSHISWKRSADAVVADRFIYFTAMLPLLPLLMLDDRSPPTLQTIVVVSFVRVEGLQTLFATLDSIWSAVASEPTAPEAQKMYGAIELILSVLQTIVSSKLLHDSSHTSLLLPKDDKNKKGDLFEPHEFLVVTRLAVLPKAKKLWMDPNVRSCPAGVVRLLINILIIILRGEGESKPEAPPLPSVMMGGGVTPHLFGARPMGPDPRRVATLVDMGFPRSAAEIALTRCGNQTAQAAEYLLTHQDIVAAAMYDQARDATSRTAPTAPASTESTTTVPSTGGQPGSSAGETASTSADVSMSEPAGSSSPKSLDQTLTPEAHKNRQEQLEDIRQGVRNTLVDRSLELLPLIDGIIFSIRDIFVFLSKEKDNTVLEGLVDVTVTAGQKHDAADSEHSQETGELFGTHLRLLALLFAEANIQAAMETHARKLLPQLMSTLSKASSSTGSQKKESNWLSPLLLMVEGFVSLSDELKSVPDEAAGDGKSKTTQEDQAMTEQLVAESDLGALLKHCISLLKQEDLSKDVVISVFRILVRLTRHHSLAVEFLEAQGLPLMFSTLKTESIGVQGQQSYIIMVMRHIIEDTVVLQATMEREIVRWFSQPSRPRVGDMVSYLRHNSFLGLRDLEAFISGTLKVCSVAKYDQAHRAELKVDETAASSSAVPLTAAVAEVTKKYSSEVSEAVMYFLVNELLNCRTTAIPEQPATSTGAAAETVIAVSGSAPETAGNSSKNSTSTTPEVALDPAFVHRCFLLQCLNELVASYPCCKVDLMNYSRKKRDPLNTASKPRTNWLGYLLNDLVPYRGTASQLSNTEIRKQSIESNFASSVLVAMCLNSDEDEEKKPFSEAVQVRRFIVDGITRAFKDAMSSTEPIELKYGKFLALSELSFKLLGSSSPGVPLKPNNDVSMNVVKVMLEKNFITTLTNVVADIDLNYPHAKVMVTALLRPLESLTRLSLKMSRASDSSAPKPRRRSTPLSAGGSGAGSGDDAPDLYRNSSLGMFDGTNIESEEDGETGDSSGDEEMFEGEEFDEDDASDASDLSEEDMSDEDEDEDDGEEDAIRNPFHDDEDDHDGSDDEDHDEDDDMDDDNEDDIDAEIQEAIDRDEEEDEDLEDEGDEDDEDASDDDEDDLEDDDDMADHEGIEEDEFEAHRHQGRNAPWDMTSTFVINEPQLRPLFEPAALAGGSRNSHAQGTDDVTTHPLLAQPASATAAGNPDNHRPRGAGPRVISDWQSFEELLQGNAQQVIGSLLNGGAIRAGHGGAFRVEVNNDHSTTLIPIERPGGHHHHHHHHHHGHQHIVNDFVPFTTPQRWSQECRMMYGATVQTKASRIQNHLINALIPLAKREAQLRQERDAKEQEQRRKADAERKKAAEEKRKADEETQRIKKEEQEKARAAEEQAEAEREAARQAEVAAARLARGETGEPESLSGAEGSSSSSATAEPAAAVTPARKLVTIDGELVDITDSDIDAEFLEALPEDMRREVYNDYLQSRPPPTATTNASHNINSEFLNALPQGMREELDELIRGPRLAANEPARPVALQADPTRLLSQLIPDLRQAMGEDLAATLPQNFLDSTQAFLSNLPRLRGPRDPRSILGGDLARPGASAPTTAKKSTVPREAIQLVDKSSLATLIRLMFLPQPLPRNILNKLLVNLCENSKTRAELLSLLLSILQDGGADLAAVDRSFAQMSLRGKTLFKANQQTKGSKGSAASAPAPVSMDNVPNLVARRCFEALYYIVSYNEQASLFFLSEHETVTLKRSGKKGKGKEKAIESKYPIVLLLDLLERPIFVQNSALMEQLMTLLSIICRPLSTLAKPKENSDKETTAEEDKEKKEVETAGTDAAGDGTSSTNAAAATVTESSDSAKTEEATGSDAKPETKTTDEQSDFQPPVIPDHCLQLVVSVLTAGECSSRTFQFTLSVIQNLSLLTGARDIITTELVNAARDLGADIRTDLDTLSQTLENAMSGVDVQGMVLDKFSPASSKQAKLLRALKTIDYMYSRKQAPANAPVAQDEERATEIYDGLSFHELWTKVGSTLEQIHERSDMIHVATVLLPLIESFMVVCKYVGLRPSTLEVEEEVCKANTNSTEELFLQFTEKHSKILNIMVRNNPALMSGSFSLLVHNPKMLEFDNKRNYFTQQMHKRNTARDLYGSLQMNVRREWVFMDSYSHWQARTGDEIKYSKLNVKFHGEEGVDGGGVTREWFQVLARQMFNPDYAMFKTSAADKLTYQPNRASWVNPDHLLFFKFVGRVIGKAIYDGRLLDAYFTRSFYKHILGRPVDYRDVEAIDPEYYKSLVWMLENDITDIVDETFSVETDDFGNKKTVDLKPNGRNIPVTEENKHEYVKYITEQKLTLAIKDQIHSFLLGFHEIIPAHLISIFNEQELELLISGLPDIDIDEWKNNAEYQNYTQSSPQILNFWRAVRSFDQTERAKLLQFVTGTSKVPLGGFAQLQGISGIQKFQIHKDFSSTKRLPSAHTCFNQLDLPEYETYEELRQQLLTAISECSTGFAFA